MVRLVIEKQALCSSCFDDDFRFSDYFDVTFIRSFDVA